MPHGQEGEGAIRTQLSDGFSAQVLSGGIQQRPQRPGEHGTWEPRPSPTPHKVNSVFSPKLAFYGVLCNPLAGTLSFWRRRLPGNHRVIIDYRPGYGASCREHGGTTCFFEASQLPLCMRFFINIPSWMSNIHYARETSAPNMAGKAHLSSPSSGCSSFTFLRSFSLLWFAKWHRDARRPAEPSFLA